MITICQHKKLPSKTKYVLHCQSILEGIKKYQMKINK